MIRHIVIVHFKKGLCDDYLALLEKTRPYLKQIPGIVSLKFYRNQSHYVPKDVTSIGIEIFFKDKASLDEFMAHPKHYEANALFEKYYADPAYMVLTYEE